MNCKEANRIKLTDLLESFGHSPVRINENEYWYLSPFRKENKASFKVNILKNIFFDHGNGVGGNTIDFLSHYLNCSISDALRKVGEINFSFHPQKTFSKSPKNSTSGLEIKKVQNLKNSILIQYLQERGIHSYKNRQLKEIYYQHKGKNYFAIGFENNKGGYELRNKYFKGCTSKALTSIRNSSSSTVYVFEGFMDYLSFCEIAERSGAENAEKLSRLNFMILNSIALVEEAIEELKSYTDIRLFFDNDDAGALTSKKIITEFPFAKNHSSLYDKHKDLNDFLMAKENSEFATFIGSM